MTWHSYDTWVVVTGALCAASCALLGSFLVLRKMSMMGDAISHSVLPGLAAAFLLTGERTSLAMFLGAVVVGILTALLTQWVQSYGRVDRGASMGVVFTTLFAVGLIMIVQAADRVDLDPGCVLYGAIELVPIDTIQFVGFTVPRAAATLAIVLLINIAVVGFFYKELKITSFDPALATTLGINASMMHYLLMTLVAVTTVASFEAIGSILVIAMLIVPAACALLLTDRLGVMILLAVAVGVACSAIGHASAIAVPPALGLGDLSASTSGMMAVTAGTIFAVAILLAPRHGLLAKWLSLWLLRLRVVREDVMGLLYRLEEIEHRRPITLDVREMTTHLERSTLLMRIALMHLTRKGYIQRPVNAVALTEAGRRRAVSIVRSHRLWESYLHEQASLPADHVHGPAERLEHITDPQLREALAEAVPARDFDPHGRPVPEAPEKIGNGDEEPGRSM